MHAFYVESFASSNDRYHLVVLPPSFCLGSLGSLGQPEASADQVDRILKHVCTR
jgi:hypothetical protein